MRSPQLCTPFLLRTLVDSELRSRRYQTFDRPILFYVSLYLERKMSLAPLGARRSHGSREGKRTHPLLHLARDDKERASSIDEQWIDEALIIALFFSPFLSASSDPILFEISLFVPNRLHNQILFHKILYQLYILLAFMSETLLVLWDLDYLDKKMMNGLWHSTRRQCRMIPPKRRERYFTLLDASDPK